MSAFARSEVVQGWIPSEVIRLARHLLGYGVHFRGAYDSWASASNAAIGYNSGNILAQVEEATVVAREGGGFERDGVVLRSPQPPFPLLACLLRAAARDQRLHVIDFGGGLGSTYRQCAPFLVGLSAIRWMVVEQPHFVAAGTGKFADDVLGFAESIDAAAQSIKANVVVLSGVLQYLPDPQKVLREIVQLAAANIIIDRTPIITGSRQLLVLQRVPDRIVRSSYPAWLFTRDGLLSPLLDKYDVVAEFDAIDAPMGGWKRVAFKGFLLEAASP